MILSQSKSLQARLKQIKKLIQICLNLLQFVKNFQKSMKKVNFCLVLVNILRKINFKIKIKMSKKTNNNYSRQKLQRKELLKDIKNIINLA